MIIKKTKDYTPVLFEHESLKDKNYIKLDLTVYSRNFITKEQSYSLNQFNFTNEIKLKKNCFNRCNYSYLTLDNLGVLISYNYNRIFVIVVTNNGNKYVIVDKYFSITYPTYFSRIKKSMKDLNISTRTNLLLWESDKIKSYFNEIINPVMEDYLPETQFKLTSEWLAQFKGLRDIRDVEVGDWITITQGTSNFNGEMQEFVGKTVQVTHITGEKTQGHKIVRFVEDTNWQWESYNEHFRFATPEEIELAKFKITENEVSTC